MPASTQPINLMFGAYRRKVLAVLLLRPDEDFHVRELERLTGVPAGSLHRELKALAAAGLLRVYSRAIRFVIRRTGRRRSTRNWRASFARPPG
jgi:DNA-binding IclR family transcriptional regulator